MAQLSSHFTLKLGVSRSTRMHPGILESDLRALVDAK